MGATVAAAAGRPRQGGVPGRNGIGAFILLPLLRSIMYALSEMYLECWMQSKQHSVALHPQRMGKLPYTCNRIGRACALVWPFRSNLAS